jgi:hypothetical protein
MGSTALLPLRKKACWGFFRPKNPMASAVCEPANLGTKDQHTTSRPPKPLTNVYNLCVLLKPALHICMSAVPHSLKVHECKFSERPAYALLTLQTLQHIVWSATLIIKFCTLGWIHLEVYAYRLSAVIPVYWDIALTHFKYSKVFPLAK